VSTASSKQWDKLLRLMSHVQDQQLYRCRRSFAQSIVLAVIPSRGIICMIASQAMQHISRDRQMVVERTMLSRGMLP